MISDFPAIVDACVLVQAAVRDTLLRLFERRLFLARWTDEIIDETVRTLREKLGRRQLSGTNRFGVFHKYRGRWQECPDEAVASAR